MHTLVFLEKTLYNDCLVAICNWVAASRLFVLKKTKYSLNEYSQWNLLLQPVSIFLYCVHAEPARWHTRFCSFQWFGCGFARQSALKVPLRTSPGCDNITSCRQLRSGILARPPSNTVLDLWVDFTIKFPAGWGPSCYTVSPWWIIIGVK